MDMLSAILRYPEEGYRERIELAWVLLATDPGAPRDDVQPASAARCLDLFHQEIRDLSDTELEELFTGTFDLNPVASLDIGWHLYGEAYERGRLLARLRELCAANEVDERGELPDHLSTVLTLLPRLSVEERTGLVTGMVLPALGKMLPPLEKNQNPYRHVLLAVRDLLSGNPADAFPPNRAAESVEVRA